MLRSWQVWWHLSLSNPFDVIKTRVYNAAPGTFKNPIDCLVKTVKESGPLALYKGLLPTFIRQAPYVVVMFMTNEQMKELFAWIDSRNATSIEQL